MKKVQSVNWEKISLLMLRLFQLGVGVLALFQVFFERLSQLQLVYWMQQGIFLLLVPFQLLGYLPTMLVGEAYPPMIYSLNSSDNLTLIVPTWLYNMIYIGIAVLIIYVLEKVYKSVQSVRENGLYSRSAEKSFFQAIQAYGTVIIVGFLVKVILYGVQFRENIESFTFSGASSESFRQFQGELQNGVVQSIPMMSLVFLIVAIVAFILYKKTVETKEDNMLTI